MSFFILNEDRGPVFQPIIEAQVVYVWTGKAMFLCGLSLHVCVHTHVPCTSIYLLDALLLMWLVNVLLLSFNT